MHISVLHRNHLNDKIILHISQYQNQLDKSQHILQSDKSFNITPTLSVDSIFQQLLVNTKINTFFSIVYSKTTIRYAKKTSKATTPL